MYSTRKYRESRKNDEHAKISSFGRGLLVAAPVTCRGAHRCVAFRRLFALKLGRLIEEVIFYDIV